MTSELGSGDNAHAEDVRGWGGEDFSSVEGGTPRERRLPLFPALPSHHTTCRQQEKTRCECGVAELCHAV